MKQQTAVEWLINQLHKKQYGDYPELSYNKMFDQAKEMEKQQIADAYESGQNETANGYYIRLGEQFYNKNYDKTN